MEQQRIAPSRSRRRRGRGTSISESFGDDPLFACESHPGRETSHEFGAQARGVFREIISECAVVVRDVGRAKCGRIEARNVCAREATRFEDFGYMRYAQVGLD